MMEAINNILICSAGRRVSLVKNFQESLSSFNEKGKVFCTDMHPELSPACHVADKSFTAPRVTEKNYPAFLRTLCLKHNISVVIPTIDTELSILASLKSEFAILGVTIVISSLDLCESFFLKSSTELFFKKHHIPTPPIISNPENANFPIFAKLNNSSCSIGATIVKNKDALRHLKGDYIFQPLIEGQEYTIDFYMSAKSELICCVPRKRLEVRAGEVSKAKTDKNPIIINAVHELAKTLQGAFGVLTVQLFLDEDDNIHFIEINPRFGGGYPLSYHSGADMVSMLLADIMGQQLKYTESWNHNTTMLRYDAEIIIHED